MEKKEIVVPGDLLGVGLNGGTNTYQKGDGVYAALLGVKHTVGKRVYVVPLGGRYIPAPGDVVIGTVIDMTGSSWIVDINAPHPALLSAKEVPWRVDFGDLARYLGIGDSALVSVLRVDELKSIQVTMRGEERGRKLVGGQLIDAQPSRVPRIIGKEGSMISLITKLTHCRVLVGQNGRLWVDGEEQGIVKVRETIKKIEAEAHTSGLTDRIRAFLEAS